MGACELGNLDLDLCNRKKFQESNMVGFACWQDRLQTNRKKARDRDQLGGHGHEQR